MSDPIGKVRHNKGVHAIMTVGGEWFTTHPADGLKRWFGNIEDWDVVYRP